MNRNKKPPLFRHWSQRYFLTLLVGIAIIGFVSLLWIRYSTIQNRIETTKRLAETLSVQVLNESGSFLNNTQIGRIIRDTQRIFSLGNPVPIFFFDANNRLVFPDGSLENRLPDRPADRPGDSPMGRLRPPDRPANMSDMLEVLPNTTETKVTKMSLEPLGTSYVAAVPILHQNRTAGTVFVILTEAETFRFQYEYRLLAILLGGGALLGWGVIYFLTKRLVRPIQTVAGAASQLMQGHYDIEFPEDAREKEIHELMESFKEMAVRLKHLDSLRTLLIAGVTHELKTPIASISGLLQAVLDEIVEGEESKEFLSLSLKEAQRLQRMVEDLLDFNGFATGALHAKCETFEIIAFIREVVYQWRVAQEEHSSLSIEVACAHEQIEMEGDPVRTQQILINLFNNGCHAMKNNGTMTVQVYSYDEHFVGIDVIDQGSEIPEDERALIFERFYRGSGKKHAVRGLGLGLPFSLMLARIQNGDLYVKESSAAGTTFTLILPKRRS